MGEQVKFRVLGPLEVGSTDGRISLGGTKPRLLLATLLFNANQTVHADVLVESLWPERRPRSPAANLRTYVSSLRSTLALVGATIRTEHAGYAISVLPGELDLLVFRELLAAARQSHRVGRLHEACGRLEEALALWRGEVLADLPSSGALTRHLEAAAEARLGAKEELLALYVATGRYGEAIGDLRALLAEHPFRESVWQQLLLALNGDGQQAEALRAYSEVRELLVNELGVEPGPELRRIHMSILAGESATAPLEQPEIPVVSRSGQLLRQLPPDVPDFTGRARSTAALQQALSSTRPARTGAPTVASVVGPPGVGKTALAVHVAHLLQEGFPDGQLHVDLAGTSGKPREPADALADLLRSLGVDGAALPERIEDRTALYRSLAAQRRMLVLFDDAASAAQVQPLLPASDWAVVVTSRCRMAELPGAKQIELDVLSPASAHALLCKIAGAERVQLEEASAAAILRACGYLPLAIRIAGARLVGRRGWPLEVLEQRLENERRRLVELRTGELAVQASFDLSYRQLPPAAARAFRLIGLLGPGSVPEWSIDALVDRGSARWVDVLLDGNLLELTGTDVLGRPRYRMHDLVRCYARNAAESEPAQLRRAAIDRVLSGWLLATTHASAGLPVSIFRPVPTGVAHWRPERSVLDRIDRAPVTWLDAEQDSLIDAVHLAVAEGSPDLACSLAISLAQYFDFRSHYGAWRRTHEIALSTEPAPRTRATLLRGLAQVHHLLDDQGGARRLFAESHALFRQTGDAVGEAFALCGLAAVERRCGRPHMAQRRLRRALVVFQQSGDKHAEAFVREAIGRTYLVLGDQAEAERWLTDSLRVSRSAGDRHREGKTLAELGRLHTAANDFQAAMSCLEPAVRILGELEDEHCTANALQRLGDLCARQGNHQRALAAVRQAHAIFQRINDHRGSAASKERSPGLNDLPG
ncbi:DNA-binding transcriptional activator of the SARP family [Saccharopolyspora kobensis]|uniref:DNA-binding transcriptional activator of the SARP family n=1 Tax=Saccharopolyspora kobensis TaxID=146035 RepID=A0A1H5XQG3_9PSEU|nr:AfsR/SARP family transcriptional regulator [Saccharopolyspora kobensis]SEG14039.1 DNA-binding transcriptional activator of the SARP family [Saccharopolyspora kobensis]SFE39260.1 DNA-binding transcriptional activator of the SARP family [Saccharopolyspora kobensis]